MASSNAASKTVTPARSTKARRNGTTGKLSEEELQQIWRTYKKTGDRNLRNVLLETHMPLVRMIAERLLQTLPKSIELDDLTSAGVFGLLDAIDGFDLDRGIKFKTYCTTRIRGSILDELRSQDWVPRLVRLKAHKLDRATRALEGKLGRSPNMIELSREMEISIEELQKTVSEANPRAMFSLSEKWDDSDDDKDMEKVEILADKKGVDPIQSLQQKDVLEAITR
ncbi:MAG: sigma-70 family RNA polymerase sigma factor, partial [Planctomycetota bacterium]